MYAALMYLLGPVVPIATIALGFGLLIIPYLALERAATPIVAALMIYKLEVIAQNRNTMYDLDAVNCGKAIWLRTRYESALNACGFLFGQFEKSDFCGQRPDFVGGTCRHSHS